MDTLQKPVLLGKRRAARKNREGHTKEGTALRAHAEAQCLDEHVGCEKLCSEGAGGGELAEVDEGCSVSGPGNVAGRINAPGVQCSCDSGGSLCLLSLLAVANFGPVQVGICKHGVRHPSSMPASRTTETSPLTTMSHGQSVKLVRLPTPSW